ncbi:MAG: hypothetical protein COU22_00375 [Candidatus Komeilibacteria bacterium CG10_big_fil_rev_8_21_14_0_10_41_13]|uniref:YknX-like C-terminal permuted SH3-like domain-containing protein n=1 Tax=Candidatus Komeilibacteria bacterium CG10_big_fil_rev_8_21_14_0_10_41_13 TaxID=1974476 RepID=A0A2M6WDB6_9BACT|nr:MAG: hypothetical protein COU22_00375 [Candidatus Komeilibacteria bacterium CG10_big_fil_rev_8_21_14_0_10_41_13]
MKKTKILILLIIPLLLSLSLSGCGKEPAPEDNQAEAETSLAEVSIVKTKASDKIETELNLSGVIKPSGRVNLISLNSGTVSAAPEAVGSQVRIGQPIAFLFNEITESNYNTALSNLTNAQISYNSLKSSAEGTVFQAELALDKAQRALELAENNYQNQSRLTEENLDNAFNNAIISTGSALDTVYLSLNSLKIVLDDSLSDDLGSIINLVDQAKISLNKAETLYNQIIEASLTQANVETQLNLTTEAGKETQLLADYIIKALNKIPISNDFTQTAKDSLISSVFSRQSSLSSSQSALQTAKQNLASIKVSNQLTLDSYLNAKNNAAIDLQNSQTALSNARQSSDNQIASAETSLRRAENEMTQAQIQKNRLTITSPLNGVLSDLNIEVGDEVSVGQNLGEVAQVKAMEIEVEIAPAIASVLTIGQKVKVNQNQEGVIGVINPTGGQASGKVKVKITLDNQNNDFVAESFATVNLPVSLPASTPETMTVPIKSVYLSADSAKVKIVEDNKIKTVTVETGRTIGELIEITGGLTEGQLVITEGAGFLADGTEVKIKE